MTTGKKVFVIGAGYIGFNVLDLLIQAGYEVTALVRRDSHAEDIRKSGASAILGDLNDAQLIKQQSISSDIIFHTASADHLSSVQAVLLALSHRAKEGKSTIYIHTSGAKVLTDSALGAFKSEKTYRDDRRGDVDWVSEDAPHRVIDLTIVQAQKQLGEGAKIAIMLPPEIYGYDSKNDRLSIMMPKIARFALKHGYGPYIGQGLSVETQVHIADLARGYVTLLNFMNTAPATELLANPYFFCENGNEFSWQEAAQQIAQILCEKGRLPAPETRSVPKEKWSDLFGERTASFMGLNCRASAVRLRSLGWEAQEKGIWESFREDEVDVIVRRWDEETKDTKR